MIRDERSWSAEGKGNGSNRQLSICQRRSSAKPIKGPALRSAEEKKDQREERSGWVKAGLPSDPPFRTLPPSKSDTTPRVSSGHGFKAGFFGSKTSPRWFLDYCARL